jgi:hypothetical protein
MRQRDKALIEAARSLNNGGDPWVTAKRLQAAIARFEARIWPRVRNDLAPTLDDVDLALHEAFSACESVQMICCHRSLYELLK